MTEQVEPSETPEPHERLDGLGPRLIIRQLYLGCLSQASYLVGSAESGRAIAVDPRRDTAEILEAAAADGLTIELIVQTHFHADFLSGHLELAEATGAPIAYGSAASTEFASRALADGEVIDLAGIHVQVMHTPGHTPESISLVVREGADGTPRAVLTGDALFIGDVGRPDLLASAGVSADELGASLYRSVHRLLELPDTTLVLPAHGAGSACGKSLSTETVSTIGEQRRTNYAVQPMTQDEFVALVTEDQPAAPGYFANAAALNREDRPLLVEAEAVPVVDLAGLDALVADGAAVVDVRPVEDFAGGHLTGSINVGLGGRFAEQVGSVVPVDTPIVLVGSAAAAQEAKVRLSRIGFDAVPGVLLDVPAVLSDHPDRASRLSRLTAAEFGSRRQDLGATLQFVDVRNPGEVTASPVEGAQNIPLARLLDRLDELERDRPLVAVCAGGARSAIASSVLSAHGFGDVSDVLGGANALGSPAACAVGPG